MPCMGPDCDWARERGRIAGEIVYRNLAEQERWPIDIDKGHFMYGGRERWNAAKEALIKAVEKLFVEDACNSF